MTFSCIKKLLLVCSVLFSMNAMARDHLIFSVAEDLPMGYENEVLRRNYYVNIGSNQGVTKGTLLTVYRIVSKSNPYDNKKRVNYHIPIGQLEVLHAEDESAVTTTKELYKAANDPIFDISNFMIGDHVSVNIK